MALPIITIEIPANPNCDAVDLRVFHNLDAPRPVLQVRLARENGPVQWHEVVAWTIAGTPAQAVAQRVDDSGEGVAFLVYGQDAGIRLRPSGSTDAWRVPHPQQWGLPFILTTDPADLKFA